MPTTNETKTEVIKGAEPEAVDVLTNVFEDATVEAKNKNASVDVTQNKTSKRGKKGGKHSKGTSTGMTRTERFNYDVDSRDMRRVARCGNCLNEMTSSKKNWNTHTDEFKARAVPKDTKGNYRYKSPGAKEGQYASQLCDDCEAKYKRGEPISFKHVTVIDQEGSVRNLEVAQLAAFEPKKPIRAPA